MWDLASRALRSRLASAGGVVLSANLASGVLNVVAIVFTIRYLAPEDFGVLTFAVTTMQLLGMVSNVGLNETLMTLVSRAETAKRPAEVSHTLSAMFRLRLVVSAVTVAAGLLLARPIAETIFGKPELTLPLAAAVVGACGVSFLQFSLTALQAFRAYRPHAVVVLVRCSALLAALLVLAGTGRLDLLGALAANVGAPFVALGASLCFPAARIAGRGSPSRPLLRRIWELSKWTIVMNFFGVLLSRLEIYLLTALALAADLAIYSAALRLCGGVLTLETAVRTVLFPEVSRRAGSPELAGFARRCVVALAILSALVYALGVLVSPLVPMLLGERYRPAIPVLLVILAARTAVIPLVPLGLLFFATERIRAGAVATALQAAVLVGTGLVLIPRYGAMGAAWTTLAVTVAVIIYMAAFARPYLRRPS